MHFYLIDTQLATDISTPTESLCNLIANFHLNARPIDKYDLFLLFFT